jgi:6-hydroxy-3-succinoylpyridine 3-monooxygenase
MSAAPPVRRKSIIYIDGFNLYYGALKGGSHKWLNLQRYFEMIRPHDDIQAIRYFTAMISGSHLANQEAYLRALETLPLVEIILGRFKAKQITCTNPECTYTGSRKFISPEEKRTDVNIAVGMLDDAYQNLAERFILISGDSDLVPAVTMLKTRFPDKQVIVYVPARNAVRGAAVELRSAADTARMLPLEKMKVAQFSARVAAGDGGCIAKPTDW